MAIAIMLRSSKFEDRTVRFDDNIDFWRMLCLECLEQGDYTPLLLTPGYQPDCQIVGG